jgi:hypothetical protein
VGSGFSKVGYPGWSDLLDLLCAASGVDPLDPGEREKPDALIDKAEECKQANPQAYGQVLESEFADKGATTHRSLIPILRLPFRAFVTTNFDPLLSNAASDLGRVGYEAYPDLQVAKVAETDRPVFYIHGHVEQGAAHLVLARSDFEAAYETSVSTFLSQLFLSYDVVFLGARLEEPDVVEVFRRLSKLRQLTLSMGRSSGERDRLILLPRVSDDVDRREATDEKETYYGELGIGTVFYPATSGHPELVRVITGVCDLASRAEEVEAVEPHGGIGP